MLLKFIDVESVECAYRLVGQLRELYPRYEWHRHENRILVEHDEAYMHIDPTTKAIIEAFCYGWSLAWKTLDKMRV